MTGKQYTIGQMAKICSMTAEQLRHYDKNHVLSPNGRGRDNDYRYYTEEQIEDLLLIKELKKVGLSLRSIAELLQNKDLERIKATLESNMLIQRQRLLEAQQSYNSLVDTLLRLNNAISLIHRSAENSAAPAEGFSIVPISERPIIFTRYRSNCSVDDPFVYRYAELLSIAEQERVTTSGTLFLLFHDHYKNNFRSWIRRRAIWSFSQTSLEASGMCSITVCSAALWPLAPRMSAITGTRSRSMTSWQNGRSASATASPGSRSRS